MVKPQRKDWRRFFSRWNTMIIVSGVLVLASGLYQIYVARVTDLSVHPARKVTTSLTLLSAMTAMLRRIHGISTTLQYSDARGQSHTFLVHISNDRGEK